MSTKLFIVHSKALNRDFLYDAKTRGQVESYILEDFDIEAVKGTNATRALELQAKGVKVTKLGE